MLYFDKNSQGDKYKVWNNWADSSPTKGNFNVIELINTATKKKKKSTLTGCINGVCFIRYGK